MDHDIMKDYLSIEKFELKEEHIKLATNMYVSWNYCEFGAPTIDPKRPYGNSYVLMDIAEILGLEIIQDADGEDVLSKEQSDICDKLHNEMHVVLEIILRCKTFEPGIYVTERCMSNWHKEN